MLHVEIIGDPLVNHESRQRASLNHFIKYLHLDEIDQALTWLLCTFKRF